jgi:hypothetical protein
MVVSTPERLRLLRLALIAAHEAEEDSVVSSIEGRLAVAGLDLSDAGIRARNAPLIAWLATPGRCLEEYMRVRSVADSLRANTNKQRACGQDTDEWRLTLLFQHEDQQRALEMHLFGSVLSFAAYDPLLVRLSLSSSVRAS